MVFRSLACWLHHSVQSIFAYSSPAPRSVQSGDWDAARAEQLESRLLLSGYAFQTVGSFGTAPNGGLIEDAQGNFYGTTQRGGVVNDGAIYEYVKATATITVLASFNGVTGSDPVGGLVMDAAGNLFGTTIFSAIGGPANHTTSYSGVGGFGDGTVFELPKGKGTITTLATFDGANGQTPQAALVIDANENLYGTTWKGGANGDGTVFEVAAGSGAITTLASFNGADGMNPLTGLVMDANGNLFGTTQLGGANNDGAIFELAQGAATINLLASFDQSNGAQPLSALLMDAAGNLFGTAILGGANNDGVIFELPQGASSITALASFDGVDGAQPQGSLVMDSGGDLFGTAHVHGAAIGGTAFELASGAGTITTLVSFNGAIGALPGGLISDASGNLFGTTRTGGLNNAGVLYRLVPGGTASNPGFIAATISSTTLPVSVIAGSTFPTGSVAISLTDKASENGILTANIYASPDGAIDSSSVLIRTAALAASFQAREPFGLVVPITVIPASVPAGNYTLLVQATDPLGNSVDATAGPGLEVVAPFVSLSEVFTALTLPSKVVSGARTNAVATLKITNAGDVRSVAPITIALYASPDGTVANGTLIATVRRLPFINPGGAALVTVPIGAIPAGLNGDYSIVAQVTDLNGLTSSVASGSTFSISAPFVTLSASIVSFNPPSLSLASKTRGSFSITITNNGNIPVGSAGSPNPFTIDLGLVSLEGDGTFQLESFRLPLALNPGASRTLTLKFTVNGVPGAVAGVYFPTVSVTAQGTSFTASAMGDSLITIA